MIQILELYQLKNIQTCFAATNLAHIARRASSTISLKGHTYILIISNVGFDICQTEGKILQFELALVSNDIGPVVKTLIISILLESLGQSTRKGIFLGKEQEKNRYNWIFIGFQNNKLWLEIHHFSCV